MELAANRVVTVFGLGNIGKRAFDLARANGLTVQAVDIRARELSQRLELHLGGVCRDISNLFHSRLITTEQVNGRNRYRTNQESLCILAKHLTQMEKFQLP